MKELKDVEASVKNIISERIQDLPLRTQLSLHINQRTKLWEGWLMPSHAIQKLTPILWNLAEEQIAKNNFDLTATRMYLTDYHTPNGLYFAAVNFTKVDSDKPIFSIDIEVTQQGDIVGKPIARRR